MTRHAQERRRPRDSFTKSLTRIAAKIAADQEYEVSFSIASLWIKNRTTKVRITGLWAAGSWAKGSLACGDLDLVVSYDSVDGKAIPAARHLRKALGCGPDVRVYEGTPAENSSGVAFEEAVPIWLPEKRDYKANIAAVKPDPTAGRFPRTTDALPLRLEQFFSRDMDVVDQAIEKKQRGITSWTWVELSDISPKTESWSDNARKLYRNVEQFGSKDAKRLYPYIIQWRESASKILSWENLSASLRGSNYRINGAWVYVGRPPLDDDSLYGLDCSALVLVPSPTARGPNGLWVIERGPGHPVVKAFGDMVAYYVANGSASVIAFTLNHSGLITKGVDFFSTKEAAEEDRSSIERDDVSSDSSIQPYEVRPASGRDLLQLISTVDVVSVDCSRFIPITSTGRLDEVFAGKAPQVATVEQMRRFFEGRPKKGRQQANRSI